MRRILLAVVPLLVSSFAYAVDLPVSYNVQDKPLKTAVAGTSLTFALYSDAGCTSQVFTTNVNIENVSVASKLKLFIAKGTAVKPPATDQLQTTLTGVTATGNLYLKVTGTGVTPSGGACQAQAGSVQVPPGLSLVVKDANGATIGIPTAANGIELNIGGKVGVINGVDATLGFQELGAQVFFFSSSDCSGQPLIVPDGDSIVPVAAYRASNHTAYLGPAPGATQSVSSQASVSSANTSQARCFGTDTFIAPDMCCHSLPSSPLQLVASPLTRDVSGFVLPFHAE